MEVKYPDILPRSFYTRSALTVAKELIGCLFVRRKGNETLSGIIVEVEAYLGEKDPASHAYRGKTKRNEVMFGEGGHLYVYFTYGMHFCANVVTGIAGKGSAVLLRAIEPVDGLETMRRNRNFVPPKRSEYDLTNGPAKLCQAFHIGREENGNDLLGDQITICRGEKINKRQVVRTSRIGISSGKDKRWRFYLKENPWVSKG